MAVGRRDRHWLKLDLSYDDWQQSTLRISWTAYVRSIRNLGFMVLSSNVQNPADFIIDIESTSAKISDPRRVLHTLKYTSLLPQASLWTLDRPSGVPFTVALEPLYSCRVPLDFDKIILELSALESNAILAVTVDRSSKQSFSRPWTLAYIKSKRKRLTSRSPGFDMTTYCLSMAHSGPGTVLLRRTVG